jgi:hypothetical protein
MNPAIASRFPLICRSKPLGLPLQERITAMVESATDPAGATHHERVARASGVINMASLIASDVGLRDLAWDMCRRHYELFARAPVLDPDCARMALQPLINLPRLLIRAGDGQRAFEALERLYRAAQRRGTAEVSGYHIDVSAVIRTVEGHRMICAELWATLLSDGIRALALGGQWAQAAEAATRHKGVGARLWEGRQVTILALIQRGALTEAARMVEASQTVDASERAVAALLRTWYTFEGHDSPGSIDFDVGEALTLIETNDPPTAYSRIQVALTALALADVTGGTPDSAARLADATMAVARTDAYAARSVLKALRCEEAQLRPIIDDAYLGRGSMPLDLLAEITGSVAEAETRLRDLVGLGNTNLGVTCSPLTRVTRD